MQAKAFREIELLEKHGPDLGAPYVKRLTGQKYKGMLELRVKQGSNINRIIYFVYVNGVFVLLHGFTKKSDSTSVRELDRALSYRFDYERRCQDE